MRLNPKVSGAAIAALRAHHGLDQSPPVRYFNWLSSVIRGEWGYSFAYNSPAAPILQVRARNTLFLTGTSTLFAWLIAVPLGVWSATVRGRWHDLFLRVASSVLLAIPDLVLALALVLFAVRTGYFPTGGMVSLEFSEAGIGGKVADLAKHLFLPVVALVLGVLPLLVAHVRAAVAEVWQSPFIIAARGYGIPHRRLLLRHRASGGS